LDPLHGAGVLLGWLEISTALEMEINRFVHDESFISALAELSGWRWREGERERENDE
jgi:hypothetical protein